jgi:hypothetical protein
VFWHYTALSRYGEQLQHLPGEDGAVESLTELRERCDEGPYKTGSPGFAAGPATKWPWFGQLAGRGYLVAAVHRGKNLLVTGEVARLLDPICRAEIERMRAADRGWAGCRIILPPGDHPASATCVPSSGPPHLRQPVPAETRLPR